MDSQTPSGETGAGETGMMVQKGFTLIELLIVVTLVGILAAMVIPAMNTAMEKTRQRTSMANMRAIANHLQVYNNDHTAFPDGSLDIGQVSDVLIVVSKRPAPTQDAWGHDFDYQSDGLTDYTVECFGRDGTPGANISPASSNNFDLDIVLSNGQFIAAVN